MLDIAPRDHLTERSLETPQAGAPTAGLPWLLATVLTLGVISILFFYHLQTSPDILRDEITYWIISNNLAQHASISLYGSPFVLHPPLMFLIEGLALRLVPGRYDFLLGTLDVRWLCAVCGLLTAGIMLAISARTTRILAGLVAVVLYGTDPLVLRTVRRNLQEAPAMFFVVIAVWLLAETRPREIRRPILAGLCVGLGLLVKEYTGFMLMLLVAQWLWPRIARRWRETSVGGMETRQVVLALAMALGVYALYPLGWALTGHWKQLVTQKTYLLSRFLGIVHDTGLHRTDTHVGFLTILQVNLQQYASSYILLAVGGLAGIWLLLTAHRHGTAVVGLWAVVITTWTAFETLHGLAEEEFYYYAIIPAAISAGALLVYALAALRSGSDRSRMPRLGRLPLALLCLAAFLGAVSYNGTVWARHYASPDDAFLQMRAYLDHNFPARMPIIAGNELDGPTFPRNAIRLIRIPGASHQQLSQYVSLTPADVRRLARSGAKYVVLSTKDVYLGYGVIGRRTARYVQEHGTVVYAPYSTTYWQLQLIRLNPRLGGT